MRRPSHTTADQRDPAAVDPFETTLRPHVQRIWAVAFAITGDQLQAAVVIDRVLLPRLTGEDLDGNADTRAGLLVAAAKAAAAARFTRQAANPNLGTGVTAPSTTRSRVQTAFSQHLPWNVQAMLWSVAVEQISERIAQKRLDDARISLAQSRTAFQYALIRVVSPDLPGSCESHLMSVVENRQRIGRGRKQAECAECADWCDTLRDVGPALASLQTTLPDVEWLRWRLAAMRSLGLIDEQEQAAAWPPKHPGAVRRRRRSHPPISGTPHDAAPLNGVDQHVARATHTAPLSEWRQRHLGSAPPPGQPDADSPPVAG